MLVCVYKRTSATHIRGWPTAHVEFSIRRPLFGMLQAASLLMSWRWMSTSVNVPLLPWVPFHLSNSLSPSFCPCQGGGENCSWLLSVCLDFPHSFVFCISNVSVSYYGRIDVMLCVCRLIYLYGGSHVCGPGQEHHWLDLITDSEVSVAMWLFRRCETENQCCRATRASPSYL